MKIAIKNTHTNNKKLAGVMLPLTVFRCLYSVAGGKKLVVEIDADFFKKVNEPNTIDEMFAESKLEYFSSKTKGFTDTKKLMDYLNA